MIKWVRLDERMIHGQVTTKWSRLLGVDRIVVGDDDASNSPVVKKSLMMAAPANCKTAIVSVDKAIEFCNDPRSEELSIMLIVATPASLLKVVQNCKGISQVNVGNFGRVSPKRGALTRKPYTVNFSAYDDEVELLHQVMETGVTCSLQILPDDTPKELSTVL